MQTGQISWLVYAINVLYFLYFVILYTERIQSVVRSFKKGRPFSGGLNCYMYGLTFLSMVGTLVLLLTQNRAMFAGIVTRSAEVYSHLDFVALSIAAGCLLFSGMVHTEFTIPGLQFGAYGSLVAAMVLKTIETVMQGGTPSHSWVTLIFIVAYSMAIPVVYPSEIKKKGLFHGIESIVSFVMVIFFTIMLAGMFMQQSITPFHPAFILFAVIGDTTILAMRWKEYVNSFVLIFLILSILMWIVGQIVI